MSGPTNSSVIQIDQWVEAKLPAATARLAELVEINSFTLNAAGVNKVQERLADRLSALGLMCETLSFPNRGNILRAESKAAQDTGGAGAIILIGHADTVHPPDSQPHLLTERDGKLFGPGACDMKAGLVVIELAMETLSVVGALDKLPIKIIINSAEENGTAETADFMSRCAALARAALVLEFGREAGDIVTARKGLFSGVLSMRGKAGHAGNNPSAGVNAIEALGHLLTSIPAAVRDPARETTFNWGVITGGSASNIIADSARVDFEVRSTTSESLSFSAQRLKNIQSTYSGPGQLEIDVGPPILPLEESKQSRELAEEYARAAIKAGLSGGIVPRQGGVSDANFVAQSGVPVIDGLGPLGGGAHTKEEYVIARSLYDKSLALIYFLLAQP